MTKAATVAFLLPFDLGLHPGVAKKKFHHIVNTTYISDFASPSHMQKANKKRQLAASAASPRSPFAAHKILAARAAVVL